MKILVCKKINKNIVFPKYSTWSFRSSEVNLETTRPITKVVNPKCCDFWPNRCILPFQRNLEVIHEAFLGLIVLYKLILDGHGLIIVVVSQEKN